MTSTIEYYSSHYGRWSSNYFYLIPSFVDYYTGDIYRMKYVSSNGSSKMYGTNSEDADEMKYTEILWNRKKTTIGIYMDVSFQRGERIEYGVTDGVRHDATPLTATIQIQIKMPQDYDGVVLFLNKNGQTEESFLKSKADDEKLSELQNQAKETGRKSKELKEIEKNMNKVSKFDLTKKDINQFYFLRISDAFPKKNKKQFPIALVIIISILVIGCGIICFLFIKKNKDSSKEEKKDKIKEKKPARSSSNKEE